MYFVEVAQGAAEAVSAVDGLALLVGEIVVGHGGPSFSLLRCRASPLDHPKSRASAARAKPLPLTGWYNGSPGEEHHQQQQGRYRRRTRPCGPCPKGIPDNVSDFYYAFQMWQYTDAGQVAGIQGKADLTLCLEPW